MSSGLCSTLGKMLNLKNVFRDNNLNVNQSIYLRRSFFRSFEVYNHLEIMVLCGHWIMEVMEQQKTDFMCGSV